MKKIPYWLALLLIPLFFVVHGWQQYYYYLTVAVAARVSGMYLLLAGVFFLLSLALLRNRYRAVFAACLLLIVFFLWGWLHSNLLHLLGAVFLAKVSVISVACLALCIVGIWQFTTRSPDGQRKILGFTSLLFFIYTLVDVGIIAWKATYGNVPDKTKYTAAALQTRMRPDVVIILFDEYASTLSLNRNLGFDNSDIDSFLLQNGFSVQRQSHSNYNLTTFSMAAMLNGGYNNFIKNRDSIDEYDFNKALNVIEKNDAVNRLTAAGYWFINLSIFDVANKPSPLTIDLFPAKSKLLTANTYYDKVLEPFVNRIKKPDSSKLWGLNNYTDILAYNRKMKEEYLEAISRQARVPRLIYLHLLLPHTPFYYDSVGRELDINIARKVTEANDPAYYINNLQVARKWLKELVSATLKDPMGKPIIMVMGDHGYKKRVGDTTRADAFANLNAIYYPDGDYTGLYDNTTNINTMKAVLNKIFVEHTTPVPDSMIFLTQRQYD